jgi:hypothetical protein
MRSNFVAAVALAQLASAAPGLLKRQNLDLGGILNAPSPSAMWPPTGPPTGPPMGPPTGPPTGPPMGPPMGPPTGPPSTGTSTTSPPTACPTTPEKGTYCGFINPEDACAPQPIGYGPQVHPDTPAAFEAYPAFSQDALSAVTPQGYANVFKNLNASVSANSYLTYETLTSYDVEGCAAFCDETTLCTAFNIYIERDPSVNPTTNGVNVGWGNHCPNPPSITNYKCSLWSSSIDAASATNYGQMRDEFEVVIAGSNGYDKLNFMKLPRSNV